MRKILLSAIFMGLVAVGAEAAISKSDDGCYHISTASELKEFAQKVNDGEVSACGKIDATSTIDISTQNWTAIGTSAKPYQGKFDGGNVEISGMKGAIGFFGFVTGGANIQNVKLTNAQSIGGSIGNRKLAGGLVAQVLNKSTDPILVNNCSFQGNFTNYLSDNSGGLIGDVAGGAKLTITNSYTKTNISSGGDKGGLVGYIHAPASVSMTNCYFFGTASSKPDIIGGLNGGNLKTQTYGASLTVDEIYCNKCATDTKLKMNYTNASGSSKSDGEYQVDGYFPQKYNEENDINAVFESNKTNISPRYDASTIDALCEAIGKPKNGITFKDSLITDDLGKTIRETYAITEASIIDGTSLDDVFNMPIDVTVDKIEIKRNFTENRWSTIILPFNFVDSETDGTINTKETTNAKFYTLTSMEIVNGKWQVQAQRIKTLVANKPYLILPAITGTLTFSGKVSLKQTTAGTSTVKDVNNTEWQFRGVYEAQRWDVDHPPFDEDNPKGFQVYGFAGQDQSEKNITAGNFVKVGYNVQIQPLRAYLYYPGYEANPDEANPTPNPSGMPALNKAPRALAKTTAESFELPDNIEVIINEDPIVIESLIIPPAPVVEEDTTGNESGNTDEGNDEDQEGTTGIAKPVTAPVMNKQATWYDLKGRRMGNKPQAQGTYIKNRTPVIVK